MIKNNTEIRFAVRSRAGTVLLVLGMLLVAANLRAAITGLGPLIEDIRAHTHLSSSLAGMLTALPLIAFAILSPLAPRIARRIGMESTLMISMVVLAVGIIVRSTPMLTTLFAGTLLIGLAIAVGNVLLPSLIKRDFPDQVGLMTGAYSVSMNVFAALASGISVPLSVGAGLGWRGSLASWAVLTVIAVVFWIPQLRRRHVMEVSGGSGVSVWRSLLAWQVTLFMGLQSFLFYINASWLPVILHERGMSVSAAGWMLSAMQFISLPMSFIVPVIAAKLSNQKGMVIGTVVFYLIGYFGLLYGDVRLTWLCMICLGIAGGASISLALAFFGLRTHNARQAAELSGMAQSIGYLLAAFGPILFGFLHDLSHDWSVSLITLIIDSVILLFVGLGAGRNTYVDSGEQRKGM